MVARSFSKTVAFFQVSLPGRRALPPPRAMSCCAAGPVALTLTPSPIRQNVAAASRQAALRAARPPTPWLPSRRPLATAPAAAADRDAEVAVFRFTLGNDAADALVPRVVGGLSAALLVVNHLLGGEPSDAQAHAEALGAVLAAAAIITPSIEQRLKELQPGRGRLAAASSVAGATSIFALQPGLPDAAKQELAWASYALLLNTNICGLAVFWDGRPVLARGLLAVPGTGAAGSTGAKGYAAAATLMALSSGGTGWLQAAAGTAALYCSDRAAIVKAGADRWAAVPEGAESLLSQPLLPVGSAADSFPSTAAGGSGVPRGLLLLLSERPRALSSKERAWAAAVAAKLHSTMNSA